VQENVVNYTVWRPLSKTISDWRVDQSEGSV